MPDDPRALHRQAKISDQLEKNCPFWNKIA